MAIIHPLDGSCFYTRGMSRDEYEHRMMQENYQKMSMNGMAYQKGYQQGPPKEVAVEKKAQSKILLLI